MKEKLRLLVTYIELDFTGSDLTQEEQTEKRIDCEKVWVVRVNNALDCKEVFAALSDTITELENVKPTYIRWDYIQ